ncbi:MAG: 16S rRNA (cytosine(1402)-N(4))-methyltransferase RsmH [Halobacteriovoraceae bacterium]|nr:16S rRNA (cytosine(1402)-N(4))-methyltransferase RsmH [Halobacteriovoraceae bacterium]
MIYTQHYSVLKNEILDYFDENAKANDKVLFADLTFGAGGHSFAILEKFTNAKVIATDQDPDALENGRKNIQQKKYESRIHLLDTNFVHFPELVGEDELFRENYGLDGILLDLGVSSHHFDKDSRGFSFRNDAELDMRMNNRSVSDQVSAKEIINTYEEGELADLIFHYGEERYSRRIAKTIVETRIKSPINTTKELENICFHAYPKKNRFGRISPATRTFQALRIAVNRELEVLKNVLPGLVPLLKKNGKIFVISFHSLEDRIVKHSFKELEDLNILTKRPILPSEEEVKENSRSRSAKLRIAVKK